MSSQIVDLSPHMADPTPVSITIKSIDFENISEKDICNTKWKMQRPGEKNPQEEFATFNSDYTITAKNWNASEKTWKYVGPNQIGFENEKICIILLNKKNLIYMDHGDVRYTGWRIF